VTWNYNLNINKFIYTCQGHVSICTQSDDVLSGQGVNEGIFILQGLFWKKILGRGVFQTSPILQGVNRYLRFLI
jgi:hypothetical protein